MSKRFDNQTVIVTGGGGGIGGATCRRFAGEGAVVAVFDLNLDAAEKVAAGIRAELYLGNPKNMGNQLKYADKRGSPCVIMQGSDEKARGEVLIKDLIVGAEIAGLSTERDDYLKKQAEAQFSVPEAELVAAVAKLLARHKAP